MAETLEPRVREILRNYVSELKSLPNEAAKRSRFSALIAELFPGSIAITEYSRGVEKLIRISSISGEKRGRADAYYGNAIIEFEKSLSANLTEAEGQLKEYVAGTWQKDKARRPILAIASDGINWKIYRPTLIAGEEPEPETVLLDELREFKVSEDSLGAFWLWLTSFLFRPQQIEPTAERFQCRTRVAFLLQGPANANKLSSDLPLRQVRRLPWDRPSYDPSFPVSPFKLFRSLHPAFKWQLLPL